MVSWLAGLHRDCGERAKVIHLTNPVVDSKLYSHKSNVSFTSKFLCILWPLHFSFISYNWALFDPNNLRQYRSTGVGKHKVMGSLCLCYSGPTFFLLSINMYFTHPDSTEVDFCVTKAAVKISYHLMVPADFPLYGQDPAPQLNNHERDVTMQM